MDDAQPRYLEERIYLPDGMDVDDYEISSFAVRVLWRSEDKWTVVQGLGYPSHMFLSQTGRWLWMPKPMHRRYCRFDFETACRLAEKYVDTVKRNGGTWAQWQQRRQATP